MTKVALDLDSSTLYYLCCFFSGLCIGAEMTNDKEKFLMASSNFRKTYKLLTVDQRKDVMREMEKAKADPRAACQQTIELLEQLKDEL